jgi:hypothetical protein
MARRRTSDQEMAQWFNYEPTALPAEPLETAVPVAAFAAPPRPILLPADPRP